MMKRRLIITGTLLAVYISYSSAQVQNQETSLKREVTLYNPYKPSVNEAQKKSFLPDMTDTVRIKQKFVYNVTAKPFMPEFTISPIKAASLLPDPLPKLYKGYIKLGMGNYFTPLAELSLTNERSKKGTVGLYARHLSGNGSVTLQNAKRVFSGFMDNDASLYGRKFFRKNYLGASASFLQRTRYAYGYDTSFFDYESDRKNTKSGYYNGAVNATFASIRNDSSELAYNFGMHYNYFHSGAGLFEHNAGINANLGGEFEGLYIGGSFGYDYYRADTTLTGNSEYIAWLSPYVAKRKDNYSFKIGLKAYIDSYMGESADFFAYPDINLSLGLVPEYIWFFADLSGKLERNNPLKLAGENPYLLTASYYKQRDTDHSLIVTSGIRGNNGLGGNYQVSASYSMINDMVLYSNFYDKTPLGIVTTEPGNHFTVTADDAKLFNIHAAVNGMAGDKITFNLGGDWYRYTMTLSEHPWNKPEWDAKLGFRYNLRNKIIAGTEITASGKRWQQVIDNAPAGIPEILETPVHVNINFNAEYRYSKILSIWMKLDDISWSRYYEWAYYPEQRFLFMLGFSYSL